jgi:alpha-glucosidase
MNSSSETEFTNNASDSGEIVLSKLAPNAEAEVGIRGLYFCPLGDLAHWHQTSTGIYARFGDADVRIDFLDTTAFRIQIKIVGGRDVAPTYAVVLDPSSWNAEFTVFDSELDLSLVSKDVRVEIRKFPFRVEAYRSDGTAIIRAAAENGLGSYARLNDEFIVTRERETSSSILGLGQKTGGLDRSGRSLILWNTDVLNPRTLKEFAMGFKPEDPRADPRSQVFDPYYISIPFYQSVDDEGRASGFFIDNLSRADYDFRQPGETRIRFAGGSYEEYVFSGPSLLSILEGYTNLTGRMGRPPLWSLGYHHCRWHPYSDKDVITHAETYRTKKIPCDSIWLDIDHMDGYRVFTWNRKLFPEPSKTLCALKELGFRTVTIVDPGVKFEPGYPVFDSGLERDAFCLTEQGAIYLGQVWPGRTAFPDFASGDARKWWGEWNAKHIQMGLSGIWNDMNEPATGDIPDSGMRFDQGKFSHGACHNGYATMMAMSTYDGLRKAMPDVRPFILSRAGSAGIQRYAANWLGDNMSRWEHLAMSIPMSLGLSLSGQSFIGADIGGFGENSEPELLVRWFQTACLSPFCRNHNDAGGIDQYPWSFGPKIESHCLKALALRYRLLPYLYTTFVWTSETGRPVMAPMAIEDQSDLALRFIDDQYMLGPDLMVAPVIEKGSTTRTVRLPKGDWYDWWTDLPLSQSLVEAEAPLDKVPLYVKAGAVIPMWSEVPQTTMNYHPACVELNVFVPLKDGVFTSRLVEDDGTSFGYERGEQLLTTFTLTRKGNELTLEGKTSGEPYPEFSRSEWRIHLRGIASASQTIASGLEAFIWSYQLNH